MRNQFKLLKAFLVASLVIFVLAVVFVAIEWYAPVPRPGPALKGVLSEVAKNAIQLLVDLGTLFMTWSLAVIGGMAYFLKANIEQQFPLTRLGLLLAEGAILTSVVSLFFGHLVINYIITMLALDIFRMDDPTFGWYVRLQYLTFLLSLLLFGAYLHHTFWARTNVYRNQPR